MFDGLNQLQDRRRAYVEAHGLPEAAPAFESRWPVASMAFLYWGQHCDMCAAPACYKTCGLFEKGRDRRCQTFVYGIGANRVLQTIHPFGMECAMKGHAHLFTHMTLPQFDARRMARLEAAWARRVEPLLRALDWPLRVVGAVPFFQKAAAYGWTKFVLYPLEKRLPARLPDGFLLQVLNPNAQTIDFQISIRNEGPQARTFLETVALEPGFNECLIPIEAIAEAVDLAGGKHVSLFVPGQEERFLVVLAADAVGIKRPLFDVPEGRKPVKCVVFDLDRTLWDGILLERGDAVRLRPGVKWLLAELDRRGILLSIASKNDPEQAVQRLKALGIANYFLFPQINWGPKSESLRTIARVLNIGLDTLAFADDSAFERAEVAQGAPEALVLTERDLALIHHHPLFQGSASAEGGQRRRLYQEQIQRETHREASGLDYDAFLKDCQIEATIERPGAGDHERLHELIQRTNQLNFSGNRYTREDLAQILADPGRECWIVRVKDRFGDYGLVGVAILETGNPARPCLTDMALSCRVQARRIEHGVLLGLDGALEAARGRAAGRHLPAHRTQWPGGQGVRRSELRARWPARRPVGTEPAAGGTSRTA